MNAHYSLSLWIAKETHSEKRKHLRVDSFKFTENSSRKEVVLLRSQGKEAGQSSPMAEDGRAEPRLGRGGERMRASWSQPSASQRHSRQGGLGGVWSSGWYSYSNGVGARDDGHLVRQTHQLSGHLKSAWQAFLCQLSLHNRTTRCLRMNSREQCLEPSPISSYCQYNVCTWFCYL